MTTFTLKDYVENKTSDVTVNVEPIPFAGLVSIQDKEDTEQMLREQLHVVQAECQRLQAILRQAGIPY
jgi:hypothetical protein